MTTSHDPNLTVDVALDAIPVVSGSFQIPLLAVPLAANSLDGDRVRSYSDADDITADETAGYLSAATANELREGLGQETRPGPPVVKVAYADLAGGTPETYATALPEIRAADPNFYGYAIQDRADGAVAEAVSAAIQTEGIGVFAFQSDDAGWLTSGVPSGYTDLAANERTIGFYHDNTGEPLAFAALCAGLQDPDSKSAPWVMSVDNVNHYDTDLTAGERLLAIGNNMNVLGEFGSAPKWIDPGTNIAGRTMRAIIMRDWLRTRLTERAYALIVTLSNQLEPVEITPDGQNDFVALLKQLIEEGIDIGHFFEGTAVAPTITATDVSLRRIRVTGDVKYIVDGRIVTYTINLNAYVPS